ncbi:hypothetical protein VTK26DRAFT_9031 [Humicola hyalothermophila]
MRRIWTAGRRPLSIVRGEAQGLLTETVPVLPDYVLDEDAVLKDADVKWGHARAPDYTKNRKFSSETKKSTRTARAGSLPDLVEKLVKNWEIEASHKTDLADWRTIDHASYTFSVNGRPPQSGEHMLRVGTYNALIQGQRVLLPGPVGLQWQPQDVQTHDAQLCVGGEKIVIKAHGGMIDIESVVVAKVSDKLQVRNVEVFLDPMGMFRQMAPDGHSGVTKETGAV